ncbi:sensor histidine kinase [Bacillus cereus]|uniref:sensor histidine kinase n=1 Tax=Bacillus cereus TaxID=1396 RepID=UPI000BFA93C3|nr:sensor histidine kinase [Bacillus cereus]PEX93248.1 ethanolamine utilization protein [Bacillus cereus]
MTSLQIHDLCEKYTNLSSAEISKIIESLHNIIIAKKYDEYDIFVDVLSKFSNEAIVVYHRQPRKGVSLYKKSAVGDKALRENEPGVLRTLETGISSHELVAKTQENHLVRQTVYPIKNKRKVIAVLIVEKDISEAIKDNFNIAKNQYNIEDVSSTLTAMVRFNESISNQLDDAILVFDKYGYVRLKNSIADTYYRNLGYLEDIQGLHYDNLSLDQTTFGDMMTNDKSSSCKKEIHIGEYYFSVKKKFIYEKDFRFVVILHDLTEMKDKEAEIISKSVAIREIHHRVKNNLQTVASLLRIQGRRCKSDEAKKYLNESVNRILAIAATHELLSKQLGDSVDMIEVIQAISYNIQRCFIDCKNVNVQMDVHQSIYIDSDRTVAIALIINELMQNSYEHAFNDYSNGTISVNISEEQGYITIELNDDGTGFDIATCVNKSLGLTIVQSYVKDKLKGSIQMNSNVNGTNITITFKK